jgi:alpha-glucosidase
VPLPWSGTRPPFGFGGSAWLPQPPSWATKTAEALTGADGSVLELYRAALRLRRATPALGDGTLRWLPSDPDVLHLARDPGFACVVNLGEQDVPLPTGARVLLASADLSGAVPPDTAAWLATDG